MNEVNEAQDIQSFDTSKENIAKVHEIVEILFTKKKYLN